ncbi:MAG TPA: ATP-binding protein, partial [Puia sp.]|nr:ATP-binding protein [Puia sp.]
CDQAATDRQDHIWAVTRSDSLMELEPDTSPGKSDLRLIAAWAKIAQSPRSLCVDGAGRVWIGTRDRGLYCLEMDGMRVKALHQLTIKDGLSENFVRYLYCDPDNVIWAATPSGLDRVSLRKDGFFVTNMTAGQGLGVLKVCQSADRTIWAVADGGFLQISPAAPAPNGYRPGVLFSQVLVGNQQVPGEAQSPMVLSHDRNTVSFNVGAPSFTDENQTRFSYLLEGGSEAGWSPPTRQSAINFVNLPPSKYTLWVRAKFLSGAYPDAVASYPFLIRPPWWQTTTFRIAGFIVLLFVIGWAIRSYTRSRLEAQRITLEKEQAIEKERTRIATDMHDDLGAGLSRIKFLSDTIGIKQQRRMSIDEEIDGIREYSKEMIDKMGEIVWALNQKHDLLSDLLSYTRSYAAAYLMQAAIQTRIEAPEEFPYIVVSGEFRRNVYLAVKEALHNIAKHSQAQQVTIRMEVGKALVIRLKDDGVGFDRARIRPYANGLVNMEKRIRDLGGDLIVDTGAGGTTVTIVVPV